MYVPSAGLYLNEDASKPYMNIEEGAEAYDDDDDDDGACGAVSSRHQTQAHIGLAGNGNDVDI